MSGMIKILCVDNKRSILKSLSGLFVDKEKYIVFVTESGTKGLEILENEGDVRIVISDDRMPDMTGVDFLRQVCDKWSETMRILLSNYADTAAVVEAIHLGQIYKVIPKSWDDEELISAVSLALDYQALQWENRKLNDQLQKKNSELQEVNKNLEDQVIKRTEALDIRNRILQVSQGVLDVLPVVVIGIDPEEMIVQCNEYARDLFPHGGIGPLGSGRTDVLSSELNELIDRLKTERLPCASIEVNHQRFRGEVRRLHDNQIQGVVLVLIPEFSS